MGEFRKIPVIEEKEDPQKVKADFKDKVLTMGAEFDKNASDYESESSEEEGEKWDAETILSTYTNTDNHPGVIKTQRRVRPSERMKVQFDR